MRPHPRIKLPIPVTCERDNRAYDTEYLDSPQDLVVLWRLHRTGWKIYLFRRWEVVSGLLASIILCQFAVFLALLHTRVGPVLRSPYVSDLDKIILALSAGLGFIIAVAVAAATLHLWWKARRVGM